MIRRALAVAVIFLFAGSRSGRTQERPGAAADLLKDAAVKLALDTAKASEPQTIDDEIRFCEVPAPPLKEAARGEVLRRSFQQAGLQNVRVDKVGNVLGDRPGAAPHPHLVVAAHLDTVFPEGTDVKVTRKDAVLYGPGIGDDCRGLATLVSVARALNRAAVQTPGTITFVANVGEEGLGDLRGMKQLFGETLRGQIDRFVTIDSSGFGVVAIGVGSRRYRMVFKGPGGHSFADFGTASPIGAMGRAIAKISNLQNTGLARATFNVGRVGGGTSINAIPSESWMEVEVRSSDAASLTALDARVQQAIEAGVTEENERWGKPRVVSVTRELVGDRAAGSTPEGSSIVQTALAVSRALGLPAPLAEGSTDANLPMSLHIPAIMIGFGGRGANAHTLNESYDTTDSWQGTTRAVLLTIALAQK